MTHTTTIMKIAIHSEKSSPVFGEGVIYVELEDLAAGPFIVLSQNLNDKDYGGKLAIDYKDEWPLVVAAVDRLMKQKNIEGAE